MKFGDKICEIVKRAHRGNPHPTVAVIARSVQAMYSDDCKLTIGSGESTYEAVCNVLSKVRLRGRMKDWVVVLSCKDSHGRHTTPSIMDERIMDILQKEGLHVAIYLREDGSLDYYTPSFI